MQIRLCEAPMHWYKKSTGSINWSSVGIRHTQKEIFSANQRCFLHFVTKYTKNVKTLDIGL